MEQSTKSSESSSENTVQHYVDKTPFQLEERVSVFMKHKQKQKYGETNTPGNPEFISQRIWYKNYNK